MDEKKYKIIFEGKIQDGFDIADVKNNIARLFKIPGEKAEQLFNRTRVVLKTGVTRDTADKYLELMSRAGAVITIEEMPQQEAAAATDRPPVAAAGPGDDSAPPANVGPIWGRRYEGVSGVPVTAAGPASPGVEYGSLERGISGDYRFTIRETLSEAWQKVRGNKGKILLAYGIYIAIFAGVGVGASLLRGLLGAVAGNSGVLAGAVLTMILNMAVAVPLMAGLYMLGVRIAVDAPARAGSVLGYYHRTGPLLLTMILMYLMLFLGFLLLILPCLYLSIAYCMAVPLVVDKKMGPWQALEASRKAISRRWFSVLGLFLVIGLLSLLGAIPLLIGLIWIIPMGLIAMGILYRNIFGVSSIPCE